MTMKEKLTVVAAAIVAIVAYFAIMAVPVVVLIGIIEIMKSDCPTFIKWVVGFAFSLFLFIAIMDDGSDDQKKRTE